MKKFGALLTFLLSVAFSSGNEPELSIGIFHEQSLESVVIRCNAANGVLIIDQLERVQLDKNDLIFCLRLENGFLYRMLNGTGGFLQSLEIHPGSPDFVFSVEPMSPKLPRREYKGGLHLYEGLAGMTLINRVPVEDYLGSVAGSEGGASDQTEFMKAQVILARTFMHRNMQRHAGEGFNLCDDVHCQAYKGESYNNGLIRNAVSMTADSLLVDGEGQPIVTFYHSNCGGTTESSKTNWLTNYDYYQPVKDPFCIDMPNAVWTDTVSRSDWLDYLVLSGFDHGRLEHFDLSSHSAVRNGYYVIGKDSLSRLRIRSDRELKSALFTIEDNGLTIILRGRGYGHGVGLCQEGAMKMAVAGYSAQEILDFYIKGVRLVSAGEIEKGTDDHDK
jgi:stage II sporulation protein D